MTSVYFTDGSAAYCGSYPSIHPGHRFPLTFTDPPYGDIVEEEWDKGFGCDDLLYYATVISEHSLPGAAIYMFGGIGTPGNRPFFDFLSKVEQKTDLQLSTLITWKKKRAYGIQWGYLFTREEIAYFVKGDVKKPRKFNVPYLDEKRGYPGYDKAHPCKSEYLRRTNVWTDVTEILRGKIHVAQKPIDLAKIAIETHTDRGEYVFDPFAGSGSTALAARELDRRFVVIERDKDTFEKMVERLK